MPGDPQDQPGDYLVATGRTWSVHQVLDLAFGAVGIDDWAPYVTTDDRFRAPRRRRPTRW